MECRFDPLPLVSDCGPNNRGSVWRLANAEVRARHSPIFFEWGAASSLLLSLLYLSGVCCTSCVTCAGPSRTTCVHVQFGGQNANPQTHTQQAPSGPVCVCFLHPSYLSMPHARLHVLHDQQQEPGKTCAKKSCTKCATYTRQLAYRGKSKRVTGKQVHGHGDRPVGSSHVGRLVHTTGHEEMRADNLRIRSSRACAGAADLDLALSKFIPQNAGWAIRLAAAHCNRERTSACSEAAPLATLHTGTCVPSAVVPTASVTRRARTCRFCTAPMPPPRRMWAWPWEDTRRSP